MIEPVTSPTFSVYFGRGVDALLLGYRYGELVEYLPKEIALPFPSLPQFRGVWTSPYTSGTYVIWPAGFDVQKPSSSRQS